jgi:hypothetical protein
VKPRIFLGSSAPGEKAVLDGDDAAARAGLLERRIEQWKAEANR